MGNAKSVTAEFEQQKTVWITVDHQRILFWATQSIRQRQRKTSTISTQGKQVSEIYSEEHPFKSWQEKLHFTANSKSVFGFWQRHRWALHADD